MTIDNAAEIMNQAIQSIIIASLPSIIMNQAIQSIIIASLPSVGAGIVIGLIIAVFQAVTQIQEQTLTFVPKMVVVFLVIAATFTWMGSMMVELSVSLWSQIPIYSR